MQYCTQLEPEALLRGFIAHPPHGFQAERLESGLPLFRTHLNLLTTADQALRNKVAALPGYRYWQRWLQWQACFIGSTVTEYTPLPMTASIDALADEVLAQAHRAPLLIVKDLPYESPLLDLQSNQRAAAFAQALAERGFVLMQGMSLAWVPIDFDSEDDYLARLSSGRRRNIRRKLRSRQVLRVETLPTGADCFDDASVCAQFYALYRNVYAQSQMHFDLLEAHFLSTLLRDAASSGCVFAYYHQDALIGWNLCYEHAGMLVDKFIGFAYPQARAHNLYAVSWMHNLAYARRAGLSHYVAGWDDPEVKRELGAHLSPMRHAVYPRNALLRMLVRRHVHRFENPVEDMPQIEALG
ncbi:GNAT family N-acetyltransferase [Xanthomonas vasicola]|uniref:GNAT family N-acetyltransferase n=1 Tax=Xanthomonas vasicola TaxID=56459 RepID=A0ABD7S5X2_XANVA|nr:GNAT family N-acetyltransferase [Xanthomonas vasicola]KGR38350.1 ATP synthase subunit alpha [Xanthomonas vasicola]KGR38922.1 ATP synthase subunit alpha [Xanthomonas vasicola]KGR59268.1 ATP synthase subunit alpha [Xanthomonas vasicola]MDO6985030.1 peptidogalycan biosysnthesis protein [Xanthomonas vasicola]PPV04534.1 GNAT family N-acetyltransferase [Xanthomonas vasicola]